MTDSKIKDEILKYFIQNGRQMIPTAAEALGYSVPTTTKYINELIEEGFFLEYGKCESQRGRKPSLYGVRADAFYYIGVDIKRFSVLIGLSDFLGQIIKTQDYSEFVFENTPHCLDSVCSKVTSFIESLDIPREKIAIVSFNISGRVDSKTGYNHSIFNFEGNDDPLSDILTEKIGIKTIIENDTRAMAYGEYMLGNAGQYQNVLFVNVSWGIGLGIITDGKLYYGKDGYAGEFGHINLYNNEIMCHCGKKGCLETEISLSAIHRKLIERIKNGESSRLSYKVRNGETITSRDIIQASIMEDTLCIELIEYTGMELGKQLANLINVFNPEAVIIGGSLAAAADYFLPPIQLAVRKYALKLICKNVVLEKSVLLENAGVCGACMIARKEYAGV